MSAFCFAHAYKKKNGAFIVLKIALSSCIKMLPFVVLNDVPINGALIVFKWCAKRQRHDARNDKER